MTMGLDKRARVSLRNGKAVGTENIALNIDMEIRELDHNRPYTYKGIDEKAKMQYAEMRNKSKRERYMRVKLTLSTEFYAIIWTKENHPGHKYRFNLLN